MKLWSICWYVCASIVVACVCFESTVGQQSAGSQKQVERTNPPKYRIGYRWRSKVNPPVLFLQISVEPKNFSRADMIALAYQLNKDFYGEPQLEVAICDDYKLAKSPELLLDIERRELLWGLRGFYELDRTRGLEAVRFSTERGKSFDEIKIDLSKSP